jgi:hypothetical protein
MRISCNNLSQTRRWPFQSGRGAGGLEGKVIISWLALPSRGVANQSRTITYSYTYHAPLAGSQSGLGMFIGVGKGSFRPKAVVGNRRVQHPQVVEIASFVGHQAAAQFADGILPASGARSNAANRSIQLPCGPVPGTRDPPWCPSVPCGRECGHRRRAAQARWCG